MGGSSPGSPFRDGRRYRHYLWILRETYEALVFLAEFLVLQALQNVTEIFISQQFTLLVAIFVN